MATFLTYTNVPFITSILIFILFSPFFTSIARADLPENIVDQAKLKTSHLHFYLHDIASGDHPTAIPVAGGKYKFGMTEVMDDALTEGANPKSKLVGRAQGMTTASSLNASSILMAASFEFVAGKYNGSTLSILGRNPIFQTAREMPVVGGTGLFRFARGYALLNTVLFNLTTGDAVVEYNVFVMHY